MSQSVYYLEEGREVAHVHQFILPNGGYGGRFKGPDPLSVVVRGVRYYAVKSAPDYDPADRFPHGSLRRALYLAYRKVRCWLWRE